MKFIFFVSRANYFTIIITFYVSHIKPFLVTYDEPFDFTASFHTYFAANIDEVVVEGLDGCKTLDRLADEPGVVSGDLKITGPVDSVYYDVPTNITLAVGDGEEVKIVSADGWKDAVVWSPWTDMACYKEFVCVENGQTGQIPIPAGGMWRSSVTMTAGGLEPGAARL